MLFFWIITTGVIMQRLPECPKCQKKMEPGHIPDMAHGSTLQTAWVAGFPEVRRFIGGIKYDKKKLVPIIAWRCPRCGYVELYAE